MEIHSGSRTLEAPRGNRYAPARGLLVMMMRRKVMSNRREHRQQVVLEAQFVNVVSAERYDINITDLFSSIYKKC